MLKAMPVKGSDLGFNGSVVSSQKKAVDRFLRSLKQADACFKNAKKILLEKIIDEKTYNIQPIMEKFEFDFISVIAKIENDISKHSEIQKKLCKTKEKYFDAMRSVYNRIYTDYNLDKAKSLGDESDLWKMRFWENEVVSFMLHFSKFYMTWEGRDEELRSTRKVNWNSMQVAKSMEKCLYANLGPLMMNIINGEIHCAKILMLNDTGHEQQIRRNDLFVQLLFNHVFIKYNLSGKLDEPVWNEKALKYYNNDVFTDHLTADEYAEGSDEDITISEIADTRIFRRGRGPLTNKLRNFMRLCIQKGVYCTLLLDESQNATGRNGVYHKFMAAVIEPEAFEKMLQDEEENGVIYCEEDAEAKEKIGEVENDKVLLKLLHNKFVRAEYWTATPPHHYGTKAEQSYGVVGLEHTGIHCTNQVWIKNINGVYMNKEGADGLKPNIVDLENCVFTIDGEKRNVLYYNPTLYSNPSKFRTHKKRQKLPATFTHEMYKEICHRIFAKLIEQQVNTTEKTHLDKCVDPSGKSWIAMRVTRQNTLTEDILIPGIVRHLKNPENFVLQTYNNTTKNKPEFEGKNFFLRKFCRVIMNKPENAGKSLVVFFTAKGRCGDQFPIDFRSFVEIPGLNCFDTTVLLQSFYGRSNGYFKGVPNVLMPKDQADLIREYIELQGVVPPSGDAKNTKWQGALAMTQDISVYQPNIDSKFDGKHYRPEKNEFECVNLKLAEALHEIEKSLIYATSHIGNSTRGMPTEIPIDVITKFVTAAKQAGIKAADVNDLQYLYKRRNGDYMRHVYFDPKKGKPAAIKVKNRGARKGDRSIGGSVSGNSQSLGGSEIFQPTLTWHPVWKNGIHVGKKLISVQLLMHSCMTVPNGTPLLGCNKYNRSTVKVTSDRVVDPNKSASGFVDGFINHEKESNDTK